MARSARHASWSASMEHPAQTRQDCDFYMRFLDKVVLSRRFGDVKHAQATGFLGHRKHLEIDLTCAGVVGLTEGCGCSGICPGVPKENSRKVPGKLLENLS